MTQDDFFLNTVRMTILFLASSLIPGYVLSINLKYLFRITILILLLLIVSMFFPLLTVSGSSYSIIDYINSGNSSYTIMFICYLATVIAVLARNKKITFSAGFIFLLGFIFSYSGLFSLGDELINQAINQNRWSSISWLLLYYVVPLIALIFYIAYTHKLNKEN